MRGEDLPQSLIGLRLACHGVRVQQASQNALPILAPILNAKQIAHRLPGLFWPLFTKAFIEHLQPIEHSQREWNLAVSHGDQLSQRAGAIGVAGVARYKYKLPLDHRPLAPRQVVRHRGGLAVFIHAKEADVEVVSGKFKIVGIAAKERNLLFGCKHEPHISVLFQPIEMVTRSLIERNDVASQARCRKRFFFNRCHDCTPRGKGVLRAQIGGNRRPDPRCDILNR